MTSAHEVVRLAQALIRIDTSNPPGRETAAAQVLADYLEAAGVECELVGPDPERLNLVARVRGRGDGPSLMLMGHTDVVPAASAGWSTPPFVATVTDGRLVGRGAADMKGELAARAVAMAVLARSEDPPAGDIVLVAAADEEGNTADVGMSWLARERPDLRCDFALNEGGGLLLELPDGRRAMTIAVGERQVGALNLRVHGRAGHPSMPALADNPLSHAAEAVRRLLAHRPLRRVPDVVRAALEDLGAPSLDDAAIDWGAHRHPLLAHLLPSMTAAAVTPTGLRTYEPPNVIPAYVDITCDCRALPAQTLADLQAHVEAALGDDLRYEFEMREPLIGGTDSPIGTSLYRACEEYAAARGATLLPLLSTGFTDSHWARTAWGTVAYGFAPVPAADPLTYLRGMHNVDEHMHVGDLVEMVDFHAAAVRSLQR